MRRCILTGFSLIILAGCGADTHDKVASETVSALNELVKVLESVKDEASAKSAVSKIDAMKPRLEALRARADKLPTPTDDESDRLEETYGPQIVEITQRMMQSSMKLAMDRKLRPYAQQIGDALDGVMPAD